MTTTLCPAKVVDFPMVSGVVYPLKVTATRSAASRNSSNDAKLVSVAGSSIHLPPYAVSCAAVACVAQYDLGALKYKSVPTRSTLMALPPWMKTPPPSPSPLTMTSSRISLFPCVTLPSMRTLPSFCSAPRASITHWSALLEGRDDAEPVPVCGVVGDAVVDVVVGAVVAAVVGAIVDGVPVVAAEAGGELSAVTPMRPVTEARANSHAAWPETIRGEAVRRETAWREKARAATVRVDATRAGDGGPSRPESATGDSPGPATGKGYWGRGEPLASTM